MNPSVKQRPKPPRGDNRTQVRDSATGHFLRRKSGTTCGHPDLVRSYLIHLFEMARGERSQTRMLTIERPEPKAATRNGTVTRSIGFQETAINTHYMRRALHWFWSKVGP
jgi:hypothetical protein